MKYIFEDEDVTDARLDIEADNQQEAWKKLVWDLFDAKGEDCPF
jgi:hypothetical protein